MKIEVVSGDVTQQQVGAIVVNLFEGVKEPSGATRAADEALDGAVSALIADGEIKGKLGEMTLVHTLGKMRPSRVLVAGLGRPFKFGSDTVRRVSAESTRYLRRINVDSFATVVHGAGTGGLEPGDSGRAIVEGAILGDYRFAKYKSDGENEGVQSMTIVESDPVKCPAIEKGAEAGTVVAEAGNLCRDLANEPANHMTPTRMAETALEVSREAHLEILVMDRPEMVDLKMGALLGVAQGSDEPPKLIILRYQGDTSDESNSLCLLGKGITFDSGGLDIKSASGMLSMKGDMAGGASVIAAMRAIGMLKPKINVVGIVPATENMPGGRAQRPGDVVRAMDGKTIEIGNTDAEGRLVLADAVAYARSIGQTRLVDVATLTGAMSVALGNVCTGVFGNDQALIDQVIESGEATGERFWQMPMFEEYKAGYRSDIADVKNTGGRGAGSITGAQFIGEFAEGAAWAHLDIAATSESTKDQGYNPKGATGVPVRTLVKLAENLAQA